MPNLRGQTVFVPIGLLIAGGLKPRTLETGGHRKAIGDSRVLLVIEIPGFTVGGGNERWRFAEVRADRRAGSE